MSDEPFDLADYLRVRRFTESFVRSPGELESMPEQARRAYLKRETNRMWVRLQLARRQYRSLREAREQVGWPYPR